MKCLGLRFKVWGLEFRGSDREFRVWGVELRVQALGFRI